MSDYLKALANLTDTERNYLIEMPQEAIEGIVDDIPKFRKVIDAQLGAISGFDLDQEVKDQVVKDAIAQYYLPK